MITFMDKTLLTHISSVKLDKAVHKQVFIPLIDPEDYSIIEKYISARGGRVSHYYEEITTLLAGFPITTIQSWEPMEKITALYDVEGEVNATLDMSVPMIKNYGTYFLPPEIPGRDVPWDGTGIKVCIIDTGIDLTNVCFKDRIKETVDFTGDGVQDGHGHGTHVAGIIGGLDPDGRYHGVAPGVEFYIAKALSNSGYGTRKGVIDSILWAVQNKVDVINMSLGSHGTPRNGTCPECRAVDWAVKQGVHVIVSAGNEGPESDSTSCPANARDVLSIGSTGKVKNISYFSSRGPTSDGRQKPEVVAPGQYITSAKSGGGWVSMSGTSMAAPHVSGTIALLKHLASEKQRKELPPADTRKLFEESSIDIGKDSNVQGWGLINLYRAHKKLLGEKLPKYKILPDSPVISKPEKSRTVPEPIGLPESKKEMPSIANVLEKDIKKEESPKKERRGFLHRPASLMILLILMSVLIYGKRNRIVSFVNRQWERIHPIQQDKLIEQAMMHFQINQPGEALEKLQKVVATHPKNHVAHALMGMIYSNEAEWDKAIDAWEAAAEAAPESTAYTINLGKAYAQAGKSEEAIGVWELIQAEGNVNSEIQTLIDIEKQKSRGK